MDFFFKTTPRSFSFDNGFLQKAFAFLICLFPVAMLYSKVANDVFFILFILLSLWVIFSGKQPFEKGFFQFAATYWPLCLATSLMFFAELLNQLFVSGFRPALFRLPLCFLFIPIIIYGVLILPTSVLRLVQWGLTGTAFLSCFFLFFASDMGSIRPTQIGDYTGLLLIPFSNLALISAFLAVMTIKWEGQSKLLIIFKVLALASAVYAAFLSESRASWVTIIILGMLVTGMFARNQKKKWAIIGCIFATSVFIFYLSSAKLQNRVITAQTDVTSFIEDSNKDTSVGIRFQLYKTSWHIFRENIWLGIGSHPSNYQTETKKWVAANIISPVAAQQSHTHNELLSYMTRYGVFGAAAFLMLTFVPFFYFYRCMRLSGKTLQTVGSMGIIFTVGIFISGLSDVLWEWRMTVQFYSVMLSILFALLVKNQFEQNKTDGASYENIENATTI